MKCLSCYWNVYENGGCCCVEPSNLCKPWQGNYWRYINKECVSKSSDEQRADNTGSPKLPFDWEEIRNKVYDDPSIIDALDHDQCDASLVLYVVQNIVERQLRASA